MTGIIQVVQTNLTTSFKTSTAGWVLVPGLAATITPNNVGNQIILLAKIGLGADGQNGVAYKFQRNGVDIDVGAAAGSRTQATGASFGTAAVLDSGLAVGESYVDSPASIAAQTYQVWVYRGNSAEVSVNRADSDTDAANFYRTTSNIILMEYQP